LHNGEIRRADEMGFRAGQVGLFTGWGIFSTLKVSAGRLFAFERHWARLKRDAELLRIPFEWTAAGLEAELRKVVEANGEQDATLRVALVRNAGTMWGSGDFARPVEMVAFTAARNVWGESARLGVVEQARHAECKFAGSKTTSWAQNLVWYEEAHAAGWDEVVLLNEHGAVSECTSANLFAVFGERVVTPGLDSGCLPGITREVLLEAVRVEGVTVETGTLRLEDLEAADAVFMTSSTRDLLRVSEIAGLRVKQERGVVERLRSGFASYEKRYFTEKQR